MARAKPTKQDGQDGPQNETDKPAGTPVKIRRRKRVFAVVCPRNEKHQSTRVYRTAGKTRYCVCDDCGETWKQVGDLSDPLGEFALELAEKLEELCDVPDQATDGTSVIVITVQEALGIAEDLKLLRDAA